MRLPVPYLGPYRFAPRPWPTLAFLLLFPLLLGLGFWQMERAGEKQALVERRAAGEVTAVLDIDAATELVAGDRYRPARVRGRYFAEQQWLLDNRVHRGQAGYHVFTPFRLAGASTASILVNRGWVAVGESREFLPPLPVPDGELTLTGRLDAPASVGLVIGEVPLDSIESRVLVQSLDIAALAAARSLDLARFALVLDEDQPGALQYDWSPIPPMGPEKHLGYAVQWFGLAVALLIIYLGVNLHRDRGDGGGHARA
jgi:surfeit locus 1 family protein